MVRTVRTVDRDGVRSMAQDESVQIVEVLPHQEFAWAHLPGARNVPLAELAAAMSDRLDRARPVVVYCHDAQCDLSPRAARRLADLGHGQVYDYVAGKMDWLSYDLPYAGEADLVARWVRRDPVVASPRDRLAGVADRMVADPAGLAAVTDDDGVVLGVIGERELADAPDGATVADVMAVGVGTVRPSEETGPLTDRLARAGRHEIVVTRSDGTLVGVFATAAARSPQSGPRP